MEGFTLRLWAFPQGTFLSQNMPRSTGGMLSLSNVCLSRKSGSVHLGYEWDTVQRRCTHFYMALTWGSQGSVHSATGTAFPNRQDLSRKVLCALRRRQRLEEAHV